MADPLPSSTTFTPSYLQAFHRASPMSANKFDEGYSEDTRSQSESDMLMRTDSQPSEAEGSMELDPEFVLPDWVMQMRENERSDFAYAILRSLRTSSIAAIVDRLNPLLHLDPVIHLPPEITFEIFSYLSPETLLRASTLSQTWRIRVMDSPLWKLLFRLEGWNSNFGVVRTFEETERQRRAVIQEREQAMYRREVERQKEMEKPLFKKRVRERQLFGDGVAENGIHDRLEPLSLDTAWGVQHGEVEADDNLVPTLEDPMEGISNENTEPVPSLARDASRRRKRSSAGDSRVAPTPPSSSMDPPLRPSLLLPTTEPKVNWQYLYKQKRRLEENWDNGRYSNFQLPHPSHPGEAHTECVYTIQYSGKYLVSGSRDRTVRVWDMDTQRLVLPPLQGHRLSVLCLQFDERPEQDLIVSGGSDCNVILWKFSTGRMIKRLDKAHSESVLNLRFDDTFLVTCSKDKSIKVWNRKELLPTDDVYPTSTKKSPALFPSYIIDMQYQVENQHLHFKPLPPHTLIMTLEGHAAAVNAIQILDGQIVSASGDRTVKAWDLRTGECVRTFTGHSKGIACVQFDGRRIVSGSSDETVRIFDRASGAEIALLHGHSNLVRTVQAQFGDLPGNAEDLEAEARAVDRDFFKAKHRGLLSDEITRTQRHARNAGSRDPSALFAFGAKLPPGGGGSRWARIVSGSYDETIIIWKRSADGSWEKSKVLYQNEAVRTAGGPGGRPRRPVAHNHGPANAATQTNNQQPAQQQQQQQLGQPPPNFQALAQQAQQQAQAAQTLAQQAQALHTASQNIGPPLPNNGAAAPLNLAMPLNLVLPPGHMGPPTQAQVQAAHQAAAAHLNLPPGHLGPPSQAHVLAAQQAAAAAANGPAPPHHHHGQHHHHAAPGQPAAGGALNPAGTSRVFKLQFDARRIVCCSQDPIIVGWDFANEDKDIILASQFFADSV